MQEMNENLKKRVKTKKSATNHQKNVKKRIDKGWHIWYSIYDENSCSKKILIFRLLLHDQSMSSLIENRRLASATGGFHIYIRNNLRTSAAR